MTSSPSPAFPATPISEANDTAAALGADQDRGLKRWLPCWRWLHNYDLGALRADGIAGLLIATLLVPQAAAYAFLADLPAGAGFLTAAFAPVGYALWATSRQVSVGPVALLSMLTATAIADAAGEPLEVAAQLALLVSIILLLIGLLRLGYLTNFISEPVLTGFIAGAALLIGASQLGNFLGIDLARGGTFLTTLRDMVRGLPDANFAALVLGLSTLLALLAAPAVVHRLCAGKDLSAGTVTTMANLSLLAVLAVAVVVTWALDLPVARVGELQVALPDIRWITFGGWEGLRNLLPDAISIAVIGYVIAYGAAASLAGRKRIAVDRDHEATALGIANLAGAFGGGYPAGASLSRSAVASTLGAHSTLASVIAGALTLGLGLASLGVFEYVASTVLAALIMKAVVGMIDVKALVRFMRVNPYDAAGVIITLLAVLTLGIRWGVAIGALASLATYLFQTSMPRVVIEGEPEDGGPLRDRDRRNVEPLASNVLVMRMDDRLYFGSSAWLEEKVIRTVADHAHIEHLVLDLKTTGMVDATGIEMLDRLNANLTQAGVTLHLAHPIKPVELSLRHAGLVKKLERGATFATARDAVEALADNG